MKKIIAVIIFFSIFVIVLVNPLRNNVSWQDHIELKGEQVKEISAQTTIEEISRYLTKEDEILTSRLNSRNRIRQIQVALKRAGFYRGKLDGKVGPKTERAVKSFQKSKGLVVDGIVEQRTWDKLCNYLKSPREGR
ncbi:MAG: peptidoglycan-binding domain-containing protein [bacterium]